MLFLNECGHNHTQKRHIYKMYETQNVTVSDLNKEDMWTVLDRDWPSSV